MDAKLGRETDALNFLTGLASEPYRYDFYQTLRRIECLYGQKPRWGTAPRPVDEPMRLGQDPDLAFAECEVEDFDLHPTIDRDRTRPRHRAFDFSVVSAHRPFHQLIESLWR